MKENDKADTTAKWHENLTIDILNGKKKKQRSNCLDISCVIIGKV